MKAMRRLSKQAIKHLVVLNMAIGILKVRKFEDVVKKAVNITKDKKVLNKQRKTLKKVEESLDHICMLTNIIFPELLQSDLDRIRKGHTREIIQSIPETTTNPELLGLYLLYINFQDEQDKKLDSILKPVLDFDYMDLIIKISEEIGLEKNVADDMYVLAHELIEKIKK